MRRVAMVSRMEKPDHIEMHPWSCVRTAKLLAVDNEQGLVRLEIPPTLAYEVVLKGAAIELLSGAKIGDRVAAIMMEDGTLRVCPI